MRTVNYEDFHVITLCSLDVTVIFWANDFQHPLEKMARTPVVVWCLSYPGGRSTPSFFERALEPRPF